MSSVVSLKTHLFSWLFFPFAILSRWWQRQAFPFSLLNWWREPVLWGFEGLDNAGKTTLVHYLFSRVPRHRAKMRPPLIQDVELFENVKVRVIDLPSIYRRNNSQSWHTTDGVVFVVDASDRERLQEAKALLQELLAEMPGVPVLIVGNKIDLPSANPATT